MVIRLDGGGKASCDPWEAIDYALKDGNCVDPGRSDGDLGGR